ncbi:MAG: 2OG-Fe(II) oxygenase [Acidobacteriota bacterium]
MPPERTREQPESSPRPVGLRAQLAQLEAILASADERLAQLRQLADPHRLAFLFRVQLGSILRGAADSQLTPGGLLAVAQQAAATGILPLTGVAALRRSLEQLTDRLRQAGAWDAHQPMAWDPLPLLSPEEERWTHLEALGQTLPIDEPLADAFADRAAASGWLALPDLLPAELITEVHHQLEAAQRQDQLTLERAGVGAEQRLSTRRSDSVLYLSGLEPELLRTAPTVAALIQYCLDELGERWAERLPGRTIFPPQKAMLARYPAPSGGYHAHLDNPGGDDDNGRTLTLVLYLNAAGEACRGGEIALWSAGVSTSEAPSHLATAAGGSGVLFDARTVAHQVQPLREGPARWALTLWFSDTPQRPPASPPIPELSRTDVLLPIDKPRLPAETLLFHELDDDHPAGEIVVYRVHRRELRVGIVCTVYRGGSALDAWCAHHLKLGIDHLVLVFDHLDELQEAADAARLQARYGADRLTVWSGELLASERWQTLADRQELERFARSGASNYAVAARQSLNASVALEAARDDELGGAPLDWLIHLDGDELFVPEGDGRGGAGIDDHFAAASEAGLHLLRYLNHELLEPPCDGQPPRFKLNPRLAATRLGPVGWAKLTAYLDMAQSDRRPYFRGYFNGKSAVAVDRAKCAAGVHGWTLEQPSPSASRLLAGPSILHCHFASADAFRRKYLAVADSPILEGPPLFEPSPVEVATLERIHQLRRSGADEETLHQSLDNLHAELTTFSEAEIEVLQAARLILTPRLDQPLPMPDPQDSV